MAILMWVLVGAGLAVLALLAVVFSRRRAALDASASLTEPRSMVHVIGNEDELREALNRAAHLEREAAEIALGRAVQYEEMLPSAPIADLASAHAKAENVDEQAHAA